MTVNLVLDTKGALPSDLIDNDKLPINNKRLHIKFNSSTFRTLQAREFTKQLGFVDNDSENKNESDDEPEFDFFATRSDNHTFRANHSLRAISDDASVQSDTSELYLKAVSLYENKHYEESERVLKSILKHDGRHEQALKLLDGLLVQKRQNNAEDLFKKTVNKKYSKKSKRKFNFRVETKKKGHAEKEVFALEPCQLEFSRFLTKSVALCKHYENLEARFVIAGYDDIRFLKDFDKDILDEIGLKPLHIKCFLRKINVFMTQVKLFQQWLKQIVIEQKLNDSTGDGLVDLFENNGIMTFEQLHRYIQSKHDLQSIINKRDNICNILWNEMQNIETECDDSYGFGEGLNGNETTQPGAAY